MSARPELLRFGATGPRAVFLHANGFAPAAYLRFLEALAEALTVDAMPLRPLWRGQTLDTRTTWADLGDDLLDVLADADGPVIAIGHSMGATASIYAAAKAPERFAALVLIEPAMVNAWQAAVIRMAPRALMRRIDPARATLRKRDRWVNREAFVNSAMRSGLYDRLSESAFETFVDSALVEVPEGVELAFDKEWEAHFYTNPPWPAPVLANVSVPVVGLRGEPSVFLDDARWNGCTRTQPGGWFRKLDGFGHLVPLEAPALTAESVLEGLRAHGVL